MSKQTLPARNHTLNDEAFTTSLRLQVASAVATTIKIPARRLPCQNTVKSCGFLTSKGVKSLRDRYVDTFRSPSKQYLSRRTLDVLNVRSYLMLPRSFPCTSIAAAQLLVCCSAANDATANTVVDSDFRLKPQDSATQYIGTVLGSVSEPCYAAQACLRQKVNAEPRCALRSVCRATQQRRVSRSPTTACCKPPLLVVREPVSPSRKSCEIASQAAYLNAMV